MNSSHEIVFQDRRIRPGKIVCVGRNYADHARELDNPVPAEAGVIRECSCQLFGRDFILDCL